jgi:hypothetical protein
MAGRGVGSEAGGRGDHLSVEEAQAEGLEVWALDHARRALRGPIVDAAEVACGCRRNGQSGMARAAGNRTGSCCSGD